MKILILGNFGLNGQDLRKGETIDVDPAHFGDNLQAFRDAGLFEEVADEAAEGVQTSAPEAAGHEQEPVAVAQAFGSSTPEEEPLADGHPYEPTA